MITATVLVTSGLRVEWRSEEAWVRLRYYGIFKTKSTVIGALATLLAGIQYVLYAAPPRSIKDKPVEYTCQLAIRNLQSF